MEGGEEIYTLDTLMNVFNPRRIGTSGAVFDIRKLNWMNKSYLSQSTTSETLLGELKQWLWNDDFLMRILPLCQTRISTLSEVMDLSSFFFSLYPEYQEDQLLPSSISREQGAILLHAFVKYIEVEDLWTKDPMYQASRWLAETFHVHHKKVVIPLLYVAITGKKQGLPLFDSMEILGKPRTRVRLVHAENMLGGVSKKLQNSIAQALKEEKFTPEFVRDLGFS